MPIPPELTDASRGERIQRVMARAGIAAKRQCEAMITAGRVSVNGQPVTDLPAWVDPARDRIEIDGEPVISPRGQKKREKQRHTYIMLHKPRHVISTTEDERDRKTVLDLVDQPSNARLFPVGRLDADSTGLILLTDDGQLANRLTHPSHGVTKQYRVTIRGKLTEDDRKTLQKGLFLTPDKPSTQKKTTTKKPTTANRGRARRTALEQIKIIRHERDRAHGDRTVLAITLREGRNREIRRLLAQRGYKVRRLTRQAIGPLQLKNLTVGAHRQLTPTEVQQLYRAANLTTH